jgi:hypothetical protein
MLGIPLKQLHRRNRKDVGDVTPADIHYWRMAESAPIALETHGRVLGQYWSSITTGQ